MTEASARKEPSLPLLFIGQEGPTATWVFRTGGKAVPPGAPRKVGSLSAAPVRTRLTEAALNQMPFAPGCTLEADSQNSFTVRVQIPADPNVLLKSRVSATSRLT